MIEVLTVVASLIVLGCASITIPLMIARVRELRAARRRGGL